LAKLLRNLSGILFILAVSTFSQPKTDAVVPIIGTGFLLGGVKNGKWLTAGETAPFLKEKEDFVLIGLRGKERNGKVYPGSKEPESESCPEVQSVVFEREFAGFGIGADAAWNLLPRATQNIALTNKTYRKAAADFLKTKGIITTPVKLSQIFRVDLDADGQNEIFLVGNYYRRGINSAQNKGDYSFVMVRKTVNGTTRNILIEGEFFKRKGEYEPPYSREVTAVADLNGDGTMEVLIYKFYYEGESAAVYELRENKFRKVFETGCGL